MLREGELAESHRALMAAFGTCPSIPLPQGEILTQQLIRPDNPVTPAPLCWISAEPPTTQLVAALRADHSRSGLLPLLLCDENEIYGQRCTVGVVRPEPVEHIDRWDAATVLARLWDGLCGADDELGPAYDLDVLAPFGYSCPPLAAPGNLLADPDILANQQIRRFTDADTRLALVPVRRGADVLTTLGWSGAANHVSRTAGLSAILRSWESRFGARVLRLGPDQLDISVAAPPQDHAHAAAVAAEHWTFCPDRVVQDSGGISAHGEEIRGRRTWSFWWD